MPLKLGFFPDGYIALNKELASGLHESLAVKLANHPVDEIDVKLAEIASHCSIALKGDYSLEERNKLCFILAGRLEVLRELPKSQTILALH